MNRLVVGVRGQRGQGGRCSRSTSGWNWCRRSAARSPRAPGTTIEVRPFDTLLIAFAREVGASVIVRGLRAVSDFDYEFQMAGMNYRLDPQIETMFLMASERHQFISSRFVKEIAQLGRRHLELRPVVDAGAHARPRPRLTFPHRRIPMRRRPLLAAGLLAPALAATVMTGATMSQADAAPDLQNTVYLDLKTGG